MLVMYSDTNAFIVYLFFFLLQPASSSIGNLITPQRIAMQFVPNCIPSYSRNPILFLLSRGDDMWATHTYQILNQYNVSKNSIELHFCFTHAIFQRVYQK